MSDAKNDSKDTNGATDVFQRAIDAAARIQDDDNRKLWLGTIARSQAASGDVNGALNTFARMQDCNEQAQTFVEMETLVEIARTQAASGDVSGALHTAALSQADHEQRKVLCIVASTQAASGDASGALNTVALIRDGYGKVLALCDVARSQAANDDVNGAANTFQSAVQTAAQIESAWWRAAALCVVARSQAANGYVNDALHSAALIQDDDDSARANALVAILWAQAACGDESGANNTLSYAVHYAKQITEVGGYNLSTLCGIALAQEASGDVNGATCTFQRAIDAVARIRDDDSRRPHLCTIARAQAASGDVNGALDTVALIQSDQPRVEALVEIVHAQAASGDFNGAVQYASQIQHVGTRRSCLCTIARAQASSGDLSGATDTFQRAVDSAMQIEESYGRASSIATIARAQAVAGDFKGAFNTISVLPDDTFRPSAFSSAVEAIAVAQITSGALIAAQITVDIIPQKDRDSAWSAIAIALANRGDLANALNCAQTIVEDGYYRNRALTAVAIAFARHDKIVDASRICESLPSGSERDGTSLLVTIAHASRADAPSHLRDAVWPRSRINDDESKAKRVAVIAQCQVESGLCQAAVTTAESILVDSDQHFPPIAEVLAKRRDLVAFKQYLYLAARDIRTALHACGQLAALYPTDARAIAELVLARPSAATQPTAPA